MNNNPQTVTDAVGLCDVTHDMPANGVFVTSGFNPNFNSSAMSVNLGEPVSRQETDSLPAKSCISLWCEKLINAFSKRSGHLLSKLVNPLNIVYSLNSRQLEELRKLDSTWFEDIGNRYGIKVYNVSSDPSCTSGIITTILRVIVEIAKLDIVDQNKYTIWSRNVSHGVSLLNRWTSFYWSVVGESSTYLVPGLYSICGFLTYAGREADRHRESISYPSSVLSNTTDDINPYASTSEKQQEVLNVIRQKIGKFRGDTTRVGGYIVLMSESIKGCLQLRSMQMAATFLTTIESSSFTNPAYSTHLLVPRKPCVEYRFYLGQLYLLREQFQKAEIVLKWAYRYCLPKHEELKKSIYKCLMTVELRLGKIPRKDVLHQYGLRNYIHIVRAVRIGDLHAFENALKINIKNFIDDGTLLGIERLKLVTFTHLIKYVVNWVTRNKSHILSGPHIFPVQLFTAAVRWQMQNDLFSFDDEEMSCILASLISSGLIKGYIAWEYKKIVFSKKDPFPGVYKDS